MGVLTAIDPAPYTVPAQPSIDITVTFEWWKGDRCFVTDMDWARYLWHQRVPDSDPARGD